MISHAAIAVIDATHIRIVAISNIVLKLLWSLPLNELKKVFIMKKIPSKIVYTLKIIDLTANHPLIATFITYILAIVIFLIAKFSIDSTDSNLIPTIGAFMTLMYGDKLISRALMENVSIKAKKAITAQEALIRKVSKSQRDSLDKAENISDEIIENISSISSNLNGVQTYGTTEVFAQIFDAKIASAKSVRNTYVDIFDHMSEQSAPESILIASYTSWLSNRLSGSWQDIVGIREFFSGRFAAIPVSEDYTGQHRLYVLRHTSSVINFIILTYEDESEEVFFGWIPEDDDGKSRIFGTKSVPLVKMFGEHFETLKSKTWSSDKKDAKNAGILIDYSKGWPERISTSKDSPIDKEGAWVTLSYSKKPNNDETPKMNRMGIIRFKNNKRSIDLTAEIFSTSGEPEESGTQHSEIAHYLNNIFVGYDLEEGGTGICHYQFIRRSNLDYIVGVYTDRRDERRNTIVGIRASKEVEGKHGHEFTPAQIKKLIADTEASLKENQNTFDSLVKGPQLK